MSRRGEKGDEAGMKRIGEGRRRRNEKEGGKRRSQRR